MAALTAHAFYTTKPDNVIPVPVKTGATIYDGALCMAGATTGGPAAPYDGTIGAILLGWNFGNVEDDGTSAPTKSAKIAPGRFIVKGLAVAGTLGGTNADIGKKVYATNDGTYTITDPTTHAVVVGWITAPISSTLADVYFTHVFGTVGV